MSRKDVREQVMHIWTLACLANYACFAGLVFANLEAINHCVHCSALETTGDSGMGVFEREGIVARFTK